MDHLGALVIFVKTKGFSPVKTRLAESIGQEAANEFYDLSVKATFSVARAIQKRMPHLEVYWAVAEKEALAASTWSDFPTFFQGTGGLGDRLAHVYEEVLAKHEFACFIGADSPHLTVNELGRAVLSTSENRTSKFVIGETADGGFYFFGGGVAIPTEIWKSVAYSCERTSLELSMRLEKIKPVLRLKPSFDIDTASDLEKYRGTTLRSNGLLPEQNSVIEWAKSLVAPADGKKE